MTVSEKLIQVISEAAIPFSNVKSSYDNLLKRIGDARFVLIGEASHGTKEFYQTRINISKALIEKKGFMAVAIEGDWPDVYHIHRYIRDEGKVDESKVGDPKVPLGAFKHFPTWMWRNETMPPFLKWLRAFNKNNKNKIGFYGLDLYSLNLSAQAVINYLSNVDKEAFEHAKKRYACFDHNIRNPQNYGYLTTSGLKKACLKEVLDQFLEIQHHALEYVKKDNNIDEAYFYASQNARIVKNAEHYYRAMFEDHVSSWNIRDEHMTETLNVIADHLENHWKKPAKIIVWAHNSHIGDARATEVSERGEVNIGQLVREQHDRDTYTIGFSTYAGSVTAASSWGAKHEEKKVNPGLPGSYEELFHQMPSKNFMIEFRGNRELEHYLKLPRLQRAIGVIYRPDTERQSHYFFTRLPYQFDALIHFDITKAVMALG